MKNFRLDTDVDVKKQLWMGSAFSAILGLLFWWPFLILAAVLFLASFGEVSE